MKEFDVNGSTTNEETEVSLEDILSGGREHTKRSYQSIYDDLVRIDETPEADKKANSINSAYTSGDDTIDQFVHRKTETTINKDLIVEFTDSGYSRASHSKPKTTKLIVSIVLIIAIVLGSIAVALINRGHGIKAGEEYYKTLAGEISNTDKTNEDGMLLKYEPLKKMNEDMVGYITLPKSDYGYPVVTEANIEKGFYQNHLFSLSENKLGTIYTSLDTLNSENKLCIFYGNASGSGMFGSLKKYLSSEFLSENPTITFDTLYSSGEWAVFSAFTFKGDEPFLIDRQSFLNDQLFNKYINNYYDNSKNKIDVDATAHDRIIVLVGVDGGKKTVVAARLLRENETATNLSKRVIVKAEEKEDTSSTESKTDGKTSSVIETLTSSITSSSPKKVVSKVDNNHLVQTGLTTDMDKTAKVEVNNVVTMINVIGMDKAGAKHVVKDTLGLNVEFRGENAADKINTIINQSVAEGAEISTDNTVILTYSLGIANGKALVPDLIGQAKAQAETLLNNANLRLGKVTETESSLEKGTILEQSYDAGKEITKSTKIDIVVSDGTGKIKTVKMPKLTGKTKSKAISAIKKAGLRVGKVTTVSSSKEAGTVVSQEVPKDAKVEEGSVIAFSISNGSKVNNLTVTNGSGSVKIGSKTYSSGAIIKGDYMDIIPAIVEAEMGSGFSKEALKAQAVAAYCWLINAGSQSGSAPSVPMKTASDKVESACREVYGVKVKYKGETAQTYYYAISAGYTANCKDVWWADIPYLRAVKSEGDEDYSGFKTTVKYSASELKSRVKDTYGVSLSGVSKSEWFKITHDENNAYVRSVNIGGKKSVSGSSFRDSLLQYELRSTAFAVKYNKSSDTFTFTVRGWGHGVGLSQVGANYYAKKGWSYTDILTHYYPGTTVS